MKQVYRKYDRVLRSGVPTNTGLSPSSLGTSLYWLGNSDPESTSAPFQSLARLRNRDVRRRQLSAAM